MVTPIPQGEMGISTPDVPRYRPFPSSKHAVTRSRYITSSDPRGFIPVFEYSLNGHWLMLDCDNGYILWTGIWKALGNPKADIVKIIEGQPELAQQVRRVRGGYLKIQGTWMPYEIALRLARRVAWSIREDLIPLFGPSFPDTCLAPGQPGYGELGSETSKRRSRRGTSSVIEGSSTTFCNAVPGGGSFSYSYSNAPQFTPGVSGQRVAMPHEGSIPPLQIQHFRDPRCQTPSTSTAPAHKRSYADFHHQGGQTPSYPRPSSTRPDISLPGISYMERQPAHSRPSPTSASGSPMYSLPPISSMDVQSVEDGADVLRRLKMDDEAPSSSQQLGGSTQRHQASGQTPWQGGSHGGSSTTSHPHSYSQGQYHNPVDPRQSSGTYAYSTNNTQNSNGSRSW